MFYISGGLNQPMYSRIVFVLLLLLLFILWRAGEAAGLSLNIAAESNQTHGIVKVNEIAPACVTSHDMTHFSDYYKACVGLEAGWCNVPGKADLQPQEMMLAAYHNRRVVYAYKGIFNRNVDSHWTGGILLNPQKIVDHCAQHNGVQPAPLSHIPGISFDKYTPHVYTSDCDTIGERPSSPGDYRWVNCRLSSSFSSTDSRVQMTMAMYVR